MNHDFQIKSHRRASDLSEDDWQPLAAGQDPFACRAFLTVAEETGAAGPSLGWKPRHLSLHGSDDRTLGILPVYLRYHSFGDFSHDGGWETAWQQAGLAYYPKLVTGIPFTPSPGPRLLTRKGEDSGDHKVRLIEAVQQQVIESGASMWQCLFVREHERDWLKQAGLLIRQGVQFHWINRGYDDFEDFLQTFTSAKRKKLKRERRAVHEAGIEIEVRHGNTIDQDLWEQIHRHYRTTFHRYGNHPAFPLEFFVRIGPALKDQLVVFIARQGDRPVASAICFRDQTRLYGRHWGTDIECPGLHFELCFYSGIEYAITHGLQRFEPGAQGEHKLARGFEPVSTWSGFWVASPAMRVPLSNFLVREAHAVKDYQSAMAQHLPYKDA